jgi:hypothetical protein
LRVLAVTQRRDVLDFRLQDDGDDDAVDGDGFAEDDGYEVLAGDARGANRPARERAPRDEDSPAGRETNDEDGWMLAN